MHWVVESTLVEERGRAIYLALTLFVDLLAGPLASAPRRHTGAIEFEPAEFVGPLAGPVGMRTSS